MRGYIIKKKKKSIIVTKSTRQNTYSKREKTMHSFGKGKFIFAEAGREGEARKVHDRTELLQGIDKAL